MKHNKSIALALLLAIFVWQPIALSHQTHYETSRLRQGNFWERDGAAAPYYIDEGCPIPGFGCVFARSEDWTFERPAQMVEELVVPDPGFPGSPSDIACASDSDCPGTCVVNNNSEMRCDLSPGTARPNVGVVYRSRLIGAWDVDWGVWNYDPSFGAVPMIIYPSVAACVETLNQFPSVVLAGPIDLLDPETAEPYFEPIGNFDFLPAEIVEKLATLPETYGVRVTRQGDDYVPSVEDPRPGYFSIFGPGASMYNKGTLIDPCVEDYETCVNDPESENFDYNEFFILEADEPVALYFAVWDEDIYAQREYYDELRAKRDREKRRIVEGRRWWKQKLIALEQELDGFIRDVGIVLGSRDSLTPGDSLRQSILGAATGGGRNSHGTCTNPVPTGKAYLQKYPSE